MIGVIADPSDHSVVCEFFELFKTPWEFYRSGRQYDVLLCAGTGAGKDAAAKLVLVYSSQPSTADTPRETGRLLSHRDYRIPIYGNCVTFDKQTSGFLVETESQRTVGYFEGSVARIGYDLFREVRFLLTTGQPAANAAIPALDLHIALLRELIVASGVELVEIPPVPEGYRFIACLTHDVDHPSIRQHKLDHTVVGFVYRAVFGSLRNLIRGRVSVRDLVANWVAVLKLPFVHLGLAKDFWRTFDDRYLQLEDGLPSTYFIIPFKNYPGRKTNSLAPAFRAARYGAQDIAGTVRKLMNAGCEVGLHGIDAWLDSSTGRKELNEIRGVTGVSAIGVRMHWLYFNHQSPQALERAGAEYDTTVGYNETVGYRAGTTQVFKPLDVSRLLELPLHAMDTAMFYPAHLGLSPEQAKARLGGLADTADQFGGCFTINWHDRSVTPERLWDASYRDLVQDLKSRGAWFATAGQAVAWFQKRRSVVFETDSMKPEDVRARVADACAESLPGLTTRVHEATGAWGDCAFDESRVLCGAGK